VGIDMSDAMSSLVRSPLGFPRRSPLGALLRCYRTTALIGSFTLWSAYCERSYPTIATGTGNPWNQTATVANYLGRAGKGYGSCPPSGSWAYLTGVHRQRCYMPFTVPGEFMSLASVNFLTNGKTETLESIGDINIYLASSETDTSTLIGSIAAADWPSSSGTTPDIELDASVLNDHLDEDVHLLIATSNEAAGSGLGWPDIATPSPKYASVQIRNATLTFTLG
jgi:hypothetical protein